MAFSYRGKRLYSSAHELELRWPGTGHLRARAKLEEILVWPDRTLSCGRHSGSRRRAWREYGISDVEPDRELGRSGTRSGTRRADAHAARRQSGILKMRSRSGH